MSPREYIEAVAVELGKLRGRGLVLSPADASLALSWHAAEVPLQAVLGEIRRGARLKSRGAGVRGAAEVGITLQALAPAIESHVKPRKAAVAKAPQGLAADLLKACREGMPGLAAWQELAHSAEALIVEGGGDYWTAALDALKRSLREVPRGSLRKLGIALRARMAPRPAGMPMSRYKRSLQMMLLQAASQELGVPPKAFLL